MTTSGSARASGGTPGMRRRPLFGPWARLASSKVGENVASRTFLRVHGPGGTDGHVRPCGSGPFGGLMAGGAGGDHQPACPALPGRAVVLLVILIGPWDTRCWPCSPRRPAGPGDCSGRDQAVQSVDDLEESVSGCGDRPGPAEVWVGLPSS